MKSNHVGHSKNRQLSTIEDKGFHMTPLSPSSRIRAIYTIRFKNGLIRPFYITFHQFGRVAPEGIIETRVGRLF